MIPTDSAEARELREAEAEELAAEARDIAAKKIQADATAAAQAQARRAHDSRCRRGWLGEDTDGHPIPCLHCRPWLAESACTTCGTTPMACRIRHGPRRGPCCADCDHHPRST